MEEKLKHREAFDIYYQMGDIRRLSDVAERLKTSKRSVEKWSVGFNWQQRVQERDKEISDLVTKQLNKQIADQKVKYHKLLQGFLSPVVKGLQYLQLKDEEARKKFLEDNPDTSIIKADSVSDLERLIKLDLLILGEDTERLGLNNFGSIKELIESVGKS